jgi:excisionase family DNA binding protein
METSLYRHFDKDGNLLYVGISINFLVRLSQHRDVSFWFSKIAEVKVEKFETRRMALEAETAAILKENPAHNLKRPKIESLIRAEINKEKDIEEEKENVRRGLFLTRKIVDVRPVYSLSEAAEAMKTSPPKIKQLIADGSLGYVKIGHRNFITGWQIIDFFEHLEKITKTSSPKE